MLIRKEHTSNNGLLGLWKITENKEELLQLFPDGLRAKAHDHVSGMKSERRAREWLSTRLMLQLLLNDEEKIVRHRRDGRPYIPDGSYNISISHTTEYAAILLHETQNVGIDIEIRSERIERLASKFISETEFVDESQKTVHQLLHWSAKESIFKQMDEIEIDFKQHLHIKPFTPQEKGIINALETKSERHRNYELEYEIHPDYVLTWGFSEP